MYLITTPWWLRLLFPGCIWQMPGKQKTVYLTFDDGPHPVATPFVLEQLQTYNARATFFCIGKNVADYPAIYQQVSTEGHVAGNHTMHHLDGWKTEDAAYIDDVEASNNLINSQMFRPPYGRIKWSQIQKLKDIKRTATGKELKIVMWSVLSGDFDTAIDGEKCFQNVIRNVQPGSIIVFHDSAKALPRLEHALPKVLKWLQNNGYKNRGLAFLIIPLLSP